MRRKPQVLSLAQVWTLSQVKTPSSAQTRWPSWSASTRVAQALSEAQLPFPVHGAAQSPLAQTSAPWQRKVQPPQKLRSLSVSTHSPTLVQQVRPVGHRCGQQAVSAMQADSARQNFSPLGQPRHLRVRRLQRPEQHSADCRQRPPGALQPPGLGRAGGRPQQRSDDSGGQPPQCVAPRTRSPRSNQGIEGIAVHRSASVARPWAVVTGPVPPTMSIGSGRGGRIGNTAYSRRRRARYVVGKIAYWRARAASASHACGRRDRLPGRGRVMATRV